MNDITSKVILPQVLTTASFHQMTVPIFGGSKLGSVIGIWESDIIDGTSTLLSWKQIVLSCTKPTNSDIYLFVSNQDTTTETQVWNGPYRNNLTSMLSFTKRYMKIRAILIQKGDLSYLYDYHSPIGPSIDQITLKGVDSGTSSKFFTKAYEIGFSPVHILMTAETNIPDGSIVRFGATNIDTTDLSKYQFFNLNEITKLNKMPVTGQKIKLYIEMSGSSGESIVVDEFAIMFSGEGVDELNR